MHVYEKRFTGTYSFKLRSSSTAKVSREISAVRFGEGPNSWSKRLLKKVPSSSIEVSMKPLLKSVIGTLDGASRDDWERSFTRLQQLCDARPFDSSKNSLMNYSILLLVQQFVHLCIGIRSLHLFDTRNRELLTSFEISAVQKRRRNDIFPVFASIQRFWRDCEIYLGKGDDICPKRLIL